MMNPSSSRLKIVPSFVVFSLAISILILGFLKTELIKPMFTSLSYPIMFVMTLLWLYKTLSIFNLFNFDEIKLKLRSHRWGILVCFLLTSLIFCSSPVYFKTLSDETNLLAVSKSFQAEKTPYNVTMGKYYYDNFNPINREIPTRPLLFPFITSLLHTLLGFHHQNVFILNFLTLCALFFLSYATAFSLTKNYTIAISTIFFVASFPVFSVYGTGGGFDLFSTLFFLLSLWSLWLFIQNKTTDSFLWLCLTLSMFANIRYESIIAILIIFPGLIFFKQISRTHLTNNILYLSISSFFVLPFAFQRYLTQGQYENPPGTPVIGLHALKEHLILFLKALDITNFTLPFNLILLTIAIILFPLLLTQLLRENKQHKPFIIIALLVFLALNAIFFAHHFGVFTHPTQSRFFMILSLAAAFSPVLYYHLNQNILTPKIYLIVSLGFFLIYHSFTTEGRFINSLTMIRETRYLHHFLNEVQSKNFLIITDRPGQFTALEYGAVNFGYANQNSAELLGDLSRALIKNIYVFQQISYKTNLPFDNQTISSSFKLKEIDRFQISADYYIKTSVIQNQNENLIENQKDGLTTQKGLKK